MSTSRWAGRALGASAAILLLAPIWAFPYFLTQDGPTHVENAKILLDYDEPEFEELRVFYVLTHSAFPNWASHVLLAGLMRVATPVVAEKLLLSGFVLLLPLVFRRTLQVIRPEARALWPLVLPFVYSHFLHLGFYNLALAEVPFLLVLAHWMKTRGEPGRRATLALVGLLLLLFFFHLVTLLLALGSLGVLVAWSGVHDARAAGRKAFGPTARRLLGLLLSAAPAVLLVHRFLAGQNLDSSEPGPGFFARWSDLWRLQELASHRPAELWLTSLLGALLLLTTAGLAIARVKTREWRATDGLLLVAAAIAIVYFMAPVTLLSRPGRSLGGGTTHDRIGPYVFLVLLLWIGGQDLGKVLRRGLVAVSVTIAAGLLAVRLPAYAEMNAHLAEYLQAAPLVERHKTLLPVSFAHQGRRADGTPVSWRVEVFLHAGAWLAVERDLVDFTNYEAELPYFPTLFRLKASPYRRLGGQQENAPPCVDLSLYEARGVRPLDYVLVWEATHADRSHPCVADILDYMEAHYERVHVSAPRARAELYRFRTLPGYK